MKNLKENIKSFWTKFREISLWGIAVLSFLFGGGIVLRFCGNDNNSLHTQTDKENQFKYLTDIKIGILPSDSLLYEDFKHYLEQLEKGEENKEWSENLGLGKWEVGVDDIEIAKKGIADIAFTWMLKAKEMDLKKDYDNAINYYEEAINTQSLNAYEGFSIANYLYSIREYEKAEYYYRELLRILEEQQEKSPKENYLSISATVLTNLGLVYYYTADYSRAIDEFESALNNLSELSRKKPKEYLPIVANTLNYLGMAYSENKDFEMAAKKYYESIEKFGKIALKNKMKRLIVLPLMSCLLLLLSISTRIFGLKRKSKQMKLIALVLFISFIGFVSWTVCKFTSKSYNFEDIKEYSSDIAMLYNNAGDLFYTVKKYPEAAEYFENAIIILRESAHNNQERLQYLSWVLYNLGVLHIDTKEYTKAQAELEESLKIRRELAADNPRKYLSNVAATLYHLGNLYGDIEEIEMALNSFKEALSIYKGYATANSEMYSVAKVLDKLGIMHLKSTEYAKAANDLNEALNIYRDLAIKIPKEYSSNKEISLIILNEVLFFIGSYYYGQGDYDETEKYVLRKLEISKELAKEYPKYNSAPVVLINKDSVAISYKDLVVNSYKQLAQIYILTKQYKKSEQHAYQALEIDSTSTAIASLAHALLFQNNFSKAEDIYKKLSHTIIENNETYTKTLLDDFEKFESAGVIPKECKANVEKIKKMLRKNINL